MVDFGLEEILEDADRRSLFPTEIAVAVLWRCCCTDGTFNNFYVGLLAVFQYLREQAGEIGEQPFLDLAHMLQAGTTEEAIRTWMKTHYPLQI